MKLKSYNILFRLFSFLSDKTNGTPFFVKYKLLLGTLILGLINTSAHAQKKETAKESTSPNMSEIELITCYKPTIPSKQENISSVTDIIKVRGQVIDENGEPFIGVLVEIRGTNKAVLTDIDGNFSIEAKENDNLSFSYVGYKPQNILVSNLQNFNIPITLEPDDVILCYEPVIVPYIYPDDIYDRPIKQINKQSYEEINVQPVSPVGNLDRFEKWVQSNIQYSEQMRMDKIKGEVILSFAIDKKGKLVDKKVVGKLSKEADQEALRALSLSERWKPGVRYDGRPIKTTMTISIYFGDE